MSNNESGDILSEETRMWCSSLALHCGALLGWRLCSTSCRILGYESFGEIQR
jgi:hypothetical protein